MTELMLKTTLHELNAAMLKKLRGLFADNAIVQITISPSVDETDYLLSTQANREHLERALKDLEDHSTYTYVDVATL